MVRPLDINFRINGTVIRDTSLLLQVIYYTRLLVLARPLGLEKGLVEKLHRVVFFTALIYAPTWLCSFQAVSAPVNGLLLLKRLLQYRKLDS